MIPDKFASSLNEIIAIQERTIAAQTRTIEAYESVFRSIARLGGNLPDDRLTGRTGPNDASARGLMYVGAREMALKALNTTLEDVWK